MALLASQRYALQNVRQVAKTESDMATVFEETVDCLRHEVAHYDWVGIYISEGKELILHAFSGDEDTPHTRITFGQGSNGLSARKGEIVNVKDAAEADREIAPLPDTKSEILVPIMSGGDVDGGLIIQATEAHAFDDNDEEFLEAVAELLGEAMDR